MREAPKRTRGFPRKITLREFWKCTVALCEVLHQGSSLNAMELLFIDNPSQIVEMAIFDGSGSIRLRPQSSHAVRS